MHIPGNAQRTGAAGGRRRAVYKPEGLTPITDPPEKATDVKRLLAISKLEVRLGRLDPRVAMAYLANAFLNALERLSGTTR
jgi:hypothetical protein